MDINQTGNSKERREQLKREIDVLGKNLPFKFEKNSQLRILKAICTYIKKDKHLGHINQPDSCTGPPFFSPNDNNMDQVSSGFITCFTKKGDLVYISDNISDYFGINALDVLFAYDNISEIPCKHDSAIFTKLFRNYQNYVLPNKVSFYSSWFVSRIQKKNIYLNEYKQFKMSGHYDTRTELFVFSCEPVLSTSNRDVLTLTHPRCFKSTHKLNLQILDYTSTFYQLLGYTSIDFQEIFNLYRLISADSLQTVVKRHKDLLLVKNTRGYIDRVKLTHRDGGYIDCLLNMYYDPKGFIVCVYQLINDEDIENYMSYMNVFNCCKNLEKSSEIYEDFSPVSSDDGEFSHGSPAAKHKLEQVSDDEEKKAKKTKLNVAEALDIYNIEEALKKELYSPRCQNSNGCTNFDFGRNCLPSDNYFGQVEHSTCEYNQNESKIENNLDSFDFENQFLQDCDLESFKCAYNLSSDFLADSNEKYNINNQYCTNNYDYFFNTIYDRQIY